MGADRVDFQAVLAQQRSLAGGPVVDGLGIAVIAVIQIEQPAFGAR